MRRRATAVGLLIALAGTGCWPAPTSTRVNPKARPSTAASPGPSDPAASSSPGTLGSTTPTQAPSIAVSTSPSAVPSIGVAGPTTLAGLVMSPATLIGNNGGNLIGNNGSSFRVLATAPQVPYANAKVRLLDAALQPVMDGGKPVETLTDAQGRYGFSSALPNQNLLVEVALPDGKGAIQALAPRGAKEANADLVSTLTTGYILNQYVKGQADPVATLEKLPPEVELETRTKAATAFEGGQAAVPEALTPEKVVSTVEQLRQSSPSFNEQMEAVKRLLIAAGQSNLGDGRVATEVGLTYIEGLTMGAAGELLFAASGTHRVWRLRADGRLGTVIGVGSYGNIGAPMPARDAGLESPHHVLFDRQGRLLVLDGGFGERLTRMAGDQVELLKTITFSHAVAPAPGDDLFVFVANNPPKVKLLKPDKTVVDYVTLAKDDWQDVRYAARWGYDPQGRVYMSSSTGEATPKTTVTRFDPTSKTLERLETVVGTGLTGLSVDTAGNIFKVDAGGKLLVKKPDGTTLTLAASLPADFKLDATGVALADDKTAYLVNKARNQIFRVRDGQFTHVAGSNGNSTGNGSDLALLSPTAMVVDAAGNLFVGDQGIYRIVKLDGAGNVTPFAGTGTKGVTGDGGPAAQATFSGFRVMRIDGADNLYILEPRGSGYAIRKIDASGQVSTLLETPRYIPDFVVTKGGTIYFPDFYETTTIYASRVMRMLPGGEPTVILPEPPNGSLYPSVALDAQDRLMMLYNGTLQRWTEAGGVETVKDFPDGWPANERIVIDPQGRMYVGSEDYVQRWNPATDTIEAIAGAGGKHFSGNGVDDSLDTWYGYLFLGPDGSLYIPDTGHKQIKRIPADQL